MPWPTSRSAKSNMRSVMKVVYLGTRWSKPTSDIKQCSIRKLLVSTLTENGAFCYRKPKKEERGWTDGRAATYTLTSMREDSSSLKFRKSKEEV